MIETLIEQLGIPTTLVEAFKEGVPENADELIGEYRKNTFESFKATPDFKQIADNLRNETFSKSQKKAIKELNLEFDLDLTNSQIDEIKDFNKEFLPLLKNKFVESSKPKNDDSHNKELQTYREQVTALKKERSSYLDQIEQLTQSTDQKIKEATDQLKAESYYSNMITKDEELLKLNVPGKAFALDAIKKNIFGSVLIDGDGKILNKDGTAFTHKSKVLNTVDELFAVYKEEAGLVKVSNAGQGNNGSPIFKPAADGKANDFNEALQRRLDEGMKNRKE